MPVKEPFSASPLENTIHCPSPWPAAPAFSGELQPGGWNQGGMAIHFSWPLMVGKVCIATTITTTRCAKLLLICLGALPFFQCLRRTNAHWPLKWINPQVTPSGLLTLFPHKTANAERCTHRIIRFPIFTTWGFVCHLYALENSRNVLYFYKSKSEIHKDGRGKDGPVPKHIYGIHT